jgi:predicted deacylase
MGTACLAERVAWREVRVGAGAAAGSVALPLGSVGHGRPVALVTAGVHGDEGPWGAWAIRRLLEQVPAGWLTGTLRLLPLANPLATEADARCAPLDGLDLNRSFPGREDGSHTEMLAAAIVREALPGVDAVIDLHGGGSWCVNAFCHAFRGGSELAAAMGAPFTVDADARGLGTVSLTTCARAQGARVTAVEMGGRGASEARWADRIAEGLVRALAAAGVLAPDPSPAPPAVRSLPVGATRVLRPRSGGVFVPQIGEDAVGTLVPSGTALGRLVHPGTFATLQTFVAPWPRTALLLLRPLLARLEAGAMTYVVAEPAAAAEPLGAWPAG